MTIQDQVKSLLVKAALPPGQVLPTGATAEQINRCTASDLFPMELKEWLSICNAPLVEPGGLFGVPPANKWLCIESLLDLFPSWLHRKWIPIAGDGCGNYYILDASTDADRHPIYFVDHEVGYDEPAYIVASNLWSFLHFILENEDLRKQGKPTYWPFHEQQTLKKDPAIAEYQGKVPLPWSV